jgi:putative methyltransferase
MSLEYTQAANAVRAVLEGRAGLKSAIFEAGKGSRNLKRVYALTCEALRRAPALEAAAAGVPALAGALRAREIDRALFIVLAYELLWGAGRIKGGGAVRRVVVEAEAALRAATGAVAARGGGGGGGGGAAAAAPTGASAGVGDAPPAASRWVRVNTLLATVRGAAAALSDAAGSPTGAALPAGAAVPSRHVPYMLRLPPGAHAALALHEHPLVTSGRLLLQDLPSALPPHALLGAPGAAAAALGAGAGGGAPLGDIIDACAAPGNKTSQLAALVAAAAAAGAGAGAGAGAAGGAGGKKKRQREGGGEAGGGRVFAFDRDPTRLARLQQRLRELGAEGRVEAACRDFLGVGHGEPALAGVTAVLLDPSCSGSGMQARWGGLERGGGAALGAGAGAGAGADGGAYAPPPVPPRDAARVRSLAAFQARALTHALGFPAVRRVVYSTCSLYHDENEAVVARAVADFNAGGGGCGARARLVECLPEWPLRGVAREGGLPEEQARCCVRWDPSQAAGGDGELGELGFFVALLEVQRG